MLPSMLIRMHNYEYVLHKFPYSELYVCHFLCHSNCSPVLVFTSLKFTPQAAAKIIKRLHHQRPTSIIILWCTNICTYMADIIIPDPTKRTENNLIKFSRSGWRLCVCVSSGFMISPNALRFVCMRTHFSWKPSSKICR